MTREEFDEFCGSLKSATHVVQWGGASVWKVGGKIFAIMPNQDPAEYQCLSFKVSNLAYEVLCQQPGIEPAPYLARAKWVQVSAPEGMDDATIRDHLHAAHEIIAGKLTKAVRRDLGLDIKTGSGGPDGETGQA